MSETLTVNSMMAAEAQQQAGIFEKVRNYVVLRYTGAALAGTLALTACTGNGSGENASSEASASPSASASVSPNENPITECGKNFETGALKENFGTPESVFPMLSSFEKGKADRKLAEPARATEVLKDIVANNHEIAAVVYTYVIETSQTQQLPDAGTIKRVEVWKNEFSKKPEVLAEKLNEICDRLNFVEQEKEFAVTRGQAMQVKRTSNKEERTYGTEVLNATENLQGFVFGFDNEAEVTNGQRAINKKLKPLMLATDDGRLIVNMTFGPGSFKIDKNTEQTPVSIKVNGDQQVVVRPDVEKGDTPVGSRPDQTNNDRPTGTNNDTNDAPGRPNAPAPVNPGPAAPAPGRPNAPAPGPANPGPQGPAGPAPGPQGPAGPGPGPAGPEGPGSDPAPETKPDPAPAPETKPDPAPAPETKPDPQPQPTQPAPQPEPRPTQPAPRPTQPAPRPTQPAPQPEPAPQKTGTPCDPNAGDVC